MEGKEYYFHENSLWGWCHIKVRDVKEKVKLFRKISSKIFHQVRKSTDDLLHRNWYYPMGLVVSVIVLVAILLLLIDSIGGQ